MMNLLQLGRVFLLVAFVGTSAADAAHPFFMGLGDLPGGSYHSEARDVSADGTIVVGTGNGSNSVFMWTLESGMIQIAAGNDPRISGDGTTVVGRGGAFRWTRDSGAQPLPLSDAWAVNYDGSVIVGRNVTGNGSIPLRWTSARGAEQIFGIERTYATAISGDGNVIAGNDGSVPSFPGRAFIWTEQNGVEHLAGLGLFSRPDSISADGSTAVGYFDDSSPTAFRWTRDGGFMPLSLLPNGARPRMAWDVSADGSVVVGSAVSGADFIAFIWDKVNGSRNVQDVLTADLGLSESLQGWTLTRSRGVSADGRTVVGVGTNPDGNTEAWIAHLGTPVPEPSTWVLGVIAVGIATLLLLRSRRLCDRSALY
jgi:uncharacterized membrane protein